VKNYNYHFTSTDGMSFNQERDSGESKIRFGLAINLSIFINFLIDKFFDFLIAIAIAIYFGI
jgi:hypothetical protein